MANNPNLNANARPFSFNPSAGAFNPNAGVFVPGGAPAAGAQPNYYAQQQAQPQGQQQPNYYAAQGQQQYQPQGYQQQQGASGYPLIGGGQQQQQPNYYAQQQQQQQYQQPQYNQQQQYQQQQYQQPQQQQQQRAPAAQQAAAAKPVAVAKPAAAKAGPPLSQAKSTISFVSNSKPAAAPAAATSPVAGAAPAAAAAAAAAVVVPASTPSPSPVAAESEESPAALASPVKAESCAASAASSSSSAPAGDSSSSSSSSDAALAKSVASLVLDPEEAKELAEAEAEERRQRIAITSAYAQRKAHDEREHVNIVFIGHVDAGKSTISGQVLLLTGQVDERTIQKYEREAKEKNRESWYLAYVMDTNEEERAKGKTVEVGRAHFETAKKRYTLLDAPGHKNYVPNMIGGASQADVGVLVISARKGEFESGFDKGGQTREHAMLAKTLGLHRLIILVNKMDDPTIKWDQKRFDEIEGKLTPFLKKTGFNMAKDVVYIPASGYTGANIRDKVTEEVCPWVKDRRSLFDVLDDMPPLPRDPSGGLRLPIVARYKDMGALFVLGKLESGTLVKDSKLLMMPNRIEVQCIGISVDDVEVEVAKPGENVLVKIKGIEEEDVQEGFVLSYPDRPCRRAAVFEGQLAMMELLEHKPILTIGYSAILHIHALAVECTVTHLVNEIDRKTGEPMAKKPKFLKAGSFANVRIKLTESIAFEAFKDYPALGRFTLRDEGKTIAIGKVLRMKDE